MLDWNEYQKQFAASNAQIGRANHEILKAYRGLSEAGNATNLLGPKVRELIALAVAVTRQCDGCIIRRNIECCFGAVYFCNLGLGICAAVAGTPGRIGNGKIDMSG